jgi:hypothetical protein
MMKNTMALLLCVGMLTGCATQPSGVSADQSKAFVEQGLVIGKIDGASSVTVKTKGRAIGGMVLGAVAGSVAASSPASLSPQGLQEAQEMGSVTANRVQRGVTDAAQHVRQALTPAPVMADKLTGIFSRLSIGSDRAAYRVDIHQANGQLDHDSLFGADKYRLHWQLKASVVDHRGKTVATSTCRGDGDIKQALDTWKADDYAAVKNVAGEVGEHCARQFLSDIGVQG